MSRHYDDFRRMRCDTRIAREEDGWYSFEDTVFYGEKGGMPSDKGSINGLPVLELRWEGDTLWHRVDGALSDPIHMEVDPVTRWINTSVQTAYHLLDGFYGRMGLHITAIGVHGEDQWYEVDSKQLPEGHLQQVQDYLDGAILNSVKTSFSYVKGSEYPNPAYQNYDEVRIVKFGDLDEQPCGTLHLNETGEIHSFVVLGSEKSTRGTRIYTTCNLLTHQQLKKDHDLIHSLCAQAKVSRQELPEKLGSLMENSKKMKKELDEVKKELLGYKAKELNESDETLLAVPVQDGGELRTLSQLLLGLTEKDRILYAEFGGCVNFALLSPAGNARAVLDRLKEKLELSGGGSPKIVSGKTPAALSEFLDAARSEME